MQSADSRIAGRTDLLRDLGARGEQIECLLAYNENVFRLPADDLTLPLADEPFVETWARYAAIVHAAGTLRALEPFLVQLRFPIRAGISQEPGYIQSARQGNFSSAAVLGRPGSTGLGLDHPEGCHVDLYPTPAGTIATVTAEARADFVRLVQAFGRKNEPDPLPASMGALMISGYRNWHRVHQVRQAYDVATARQILADPASSQDRFILLSKGPYSGVSAAEMQLDDETWAEASWRIRREHEVCHYFCRRALGAMRNNVYDEMLADYCGIVRGAGSFRAEWLLRFLGLEHAPAYRPGGRLENYRGSPPLDDAAFSVLQRLVYRAALNIEIFDREIRSRENERQDWLLAVLALSSLHVEELAGPSALPLLAIAYARLSSRFATESKTLNTLPKERQEVVA